MGSSTSDTSHAHQLLGMELPPWWPLVRLLRCWRLVERSLKYDVMPRGGLIMPLPDGIERDHTPVQIKDGPNNQALVCSEPR